MFAPLKAGGTEEGSERMKAGMPKAKWRVSFARISPERVRKNHLLISVQPAVNEQKNGDNRMVWKERQNPLQKNRKAGSFGFNSRTGNRAVFLFHLQKNGRVAESKQLV